MSAAEGSSQQVLRQQVFRHPIGGFERALRKAYDRLMRGLDLIERLHPRGDPGLVGLGRHALPFTRQGSADLLWTGGSPAQGKRSFSSDRNSASTSRTTRPAHGPHPEASPPAAPWRRYL